MKQRIQSVSNFLNIKIVSLCKTKEFEKYRSFYGEAFALASLDKVSKLEECQEYLVELFKNKKNLDDDFHFEFINYALITSSKIKDILIDEIYPLKFRGTKCTNWTLLRERVLFEEDPKRDLKEVLEKLNERQRPSGLVLDDPWDKSFQYHCFSISMIGEIFEITQNEKLLESFEKGIDFIIPFISPTGETTFIGRGQSQSFGYSSLLYSLVLAEKLLQRNLTKEISLVLSLIESQISKYSDLPLVMNQNIENPYVVDVNDPKYCGWYPYNNYIDYLCFSSYFITKASLLYSGAQYELSVVEKRLSDNDFIVHDEKYFGVVSNVGGYWVNDLPIPYVQYKGESILPLYGGDQFHSELYKYGDVPIPENKIFNFSIRKNCDSTIVDNTLIVKSFLGNFKRNYAFKEDSICIENEFKFPFLFRTPYFFLKGTKFKSDNVLIYKDVEFIFSKKIIKRSSTYSVSGEIMKYEVEGNHTMEIKFL